MNIPYEYIIHDIRNSKDFKGITICGYKRRDVLNAFQNSIVNNKVEDAIRWCVELHSTGLNKQIWDTFDNIYTKYIHINNPKLFFYLSKRKKEYLNIIKKYPKRHEIFTRNNQEIRNLYAELTAIYSLTKKNNMFLPKSLPPIKNISFEPLEMKKRMISKNLNNIMDFSHNTTNNETKLALNEIMNNLLYTNGTFQNCLFWYLWLEKYFQKNKDTINSNNIVFENVHLTKDEQYFDNWTFILWSIILSFNNKLDKNSFIFIKKMEQIYKKDFKPSFINKKKYYFFISFYIIKNNISWNVLLYPFEHLIIQTNANINIMYKNIIKSVESNLSSDTKHSLYKKYNQLFFNLNNKKSIQPKKIKNTNLDEDINKIIYTSHPEYYDLKSNNNSNNYDEIINEELNKKKLVHKNKTQRDIIEQKMEEKNKRIEAFSNFIAYKKKDEKKDEKQDKHKMSVIDYYKDIEINNRNKPIEQTKQTEDNNDEESYSEIYDKKSKSKKTSKKEDKRKYKIEKI